MKLVEKHIANSLLTIAFILAFGNTAFAYTPESVKPETATISSLQVHQNSKPIFFEEVSLAEVSQSVSQTEPFNFALWASVTSSNNASQSKKLSVAPSFYLQKDRRQLIGQQIFPFHFFW